VLLLMAVVMMLLMIRLPQVVHGILLSHEIIHYNAFKMER
jgi:hypothetical protein